MGTARGRKESLPYPQRGRPLVPAPLDQVFGNELLDPWGEGDVDPALRWSDLDQTVWSRFPPEEVHRLARLVVRRLGARYSALAASEEPVTDRPTPLMVMDLPLRIENSLRRHGYIRDGIVQPIDLGTFSRMRNVGARSILAFLLDAPRHGTRRASAPRDPGSWAAARGLARKPWASQVSSRDPRFGATIRVLFPGARDAAEAAVEAARSPTLSGAQTAAEIARLQRSMDRARAARLPDELRDVLTTIVSPPHARALRRRFGWDGRPPGTLVDAARTIRVSRERVRQLEARFTERIRRRGSVWTPALDRALAILGSCGACSDAELTRRLRAAGLATRPFTREALLKAASVLGTRVSDRPSEKKKPRVHHRPRGAGEDSPG